MSRSLGRLCGPLVAVAGLFGALTTPAAAADDGYANVFSSVLGAVGVIKPDPGPEIDYRERPPLVLPPATLTQLPKPAPVATRTAAWPKDPDILRRKKASEEARAPIVNSDDVRVRAAELQRNRVAQGEPVQAKDCGVNGNSANCLTLNPRELQAMSDRFNAQNPDKQDALQPGHEPERVYLTQPPKGYMAPTKLVKATTEAPAPRDDSANPLSFLHPQKNPDE